jgi:hypothetical protein
MCGRLAKLKIERITNCLQPMFCMSATSNKSRILIFLMIIISVVFFIASFMAAAFNSSPPSTPQEEGDFKNCIVVRTGERMFAECLP